MPGIAALAFQAYGTQRQCQVVDHYQYVFQLDFLLVHPISHRITAKIHISGWLKKKQLLVLEAHFRHIAITLGCKSDIGCLGQGIQYHKTYIVAGISVFRTDVT